jgi:hypothetical protein
MGAGEVHIGVWLGDPMEGDHLEDMGVDGRIILNGSSRNGIRRHGVDCSVSGQGQVTGACEYCNEPSGSIKCGAFLD